YILIGIAIFILILAIVNFINLSTALSIKRSKEIGMRKVLGVGRPGLTMQLFTETAVFTILGVVTACLLVNPVLTLFSRYIPQGISFSLGDARLMVFLGAITVLTTLLAGFYPARVLTSLIPVLSLKGISNTGSPSNLGLRKGLIVFQFTVSLVFIIGTFVMNRQISYMRTADKGFKTDAILTVQNWGDEHDKMKLLVQKVKKLPGVDDAVLQRDNPMGFAETSQRLEYKGEREGELEVIMKTGDERFIPFYKMKLVAGRNILGSDSASEMIVNESCARAMGYPNPADAVGKFFQPMQ
ncbi:MAG: FtsX-like permease family protein, partial [Chitinophagaceae bacterium]